MNVQNIIKEFKSGEDLPSIKEFAPKRSYLFYSIVFVILAIFEARSWWATLFILLSWWLLAFSVAKGNALVEKKEYLDVKVVVDGEERD